MNYIFCSVIWGNIKDTPGFTATGIAAARLDEKGRVLENKRFTPRECNGKTIAETFVSWCGEGFMLCVWDGYTAGRMKKFLTYSGIKHPYEHMYHLSRVFELSVLRQEDAARRRIMQSRMNHKPYTHGRIAGAENELKWMCDLFAMLDFTTVEKKPAVDYTEQPSNKYFVFKNGKCFHTKDCRIVQDAVPASMRAYTYFKSAVDAGFSPCSRCKPSDMDCETSPEMKRINEEKLREAQAQHSDGDSPKPVKRVRKPNVFRSLKHMCSLYHLGFEREGQTVYIITEAGKWYFEPEAEKITLMRQKNDKYVTERRKFSEPYAAVRYIAAQSKNENDN